ncbi:MAG: hypothetical protein U5K43_14515 [Halofilum sp. (in: g-proteobacteria)]|nr:hypothetical protein [Halofilum sp. (in: g-proteobacteria)]
MATIDDTVHFVGPQPRGHRRWRTCSSITARRVAGSRRAAGQPGARRDPGARPWRGAGLGSAARGRRASRCLYERAPRLAARRAGGWRIAGTPRVQPGAPGRRAARAPTTAR